jgi:uncharacterized protein (TIGR03437 family)
MSLRVPIVNQITGLAGIPAGGGALITTTNVPQNLAGWTLTIGGVKTSFIMGGASQIYAQVPSSLPVGPTTVQLTSPNGDAVPSVILQIDPPAPVIQAAVNAVGTPIDGTHPVRPGDSIVLSVAQLEDPSVTNTPSIHIYVGGVDHVPSNILPGSLPGTFQIQVTLARGVPFGTQPVIIGVDVTRQSAPYNINILPQ